MDAPNELSYKPPPEFEEVKKDSLINLSLTDSTELWLIQWPFNQHPDLNGQEVSLKLHHDGNMGSFVDSSGKSYEMVNCKALDPDAMVFLSSESEPKIDAFFPLIVIILKYHVWFVAPVMMIMHVLAAGKISRRVSLIHYPQPCELKQNSINLKQMMAQRSSGTTLTNSSRRFATPTQSTRMRSIMRSGSSSKSTKRKHIDGPVKSNDQSIQDSGRSGRSALTSSGSFDQSQDQKSKKRKIDD